LSASAPFWKWRRMSFVDGRQFGGNSPTAIAASREHQNV
jgi:hypothetical protein